MDNVHLQASSPRYSPPSEHLHRHISIWTHLAFKSSNTIPKTWPRSNYFQCVQRFDSRVDPCCVRHPGQKVTTVALFTRRRKNNQQIGELCKSKQVCKKFWSQTPKLTYASQIHLLLLYFLSPRIRDSYCYSCVTKKRAYTLSNS